MKTIEGYNTATVIYPSRKACIDAAIADLEGYRYNPKCAGTVDGKPPTGITISIPFKKERGYPIVGYIESPEIYSLHYVEQEEGRGWLYDSIP